MGVFCGPTGNFPEPRPRLEFARQLFKHATILYQDHLHLTENRNIKFSKLIIETLEDVL